AAQFIVHGAGSSLSILIANGAYAISLITGIAVPVTISSKQRKILLTRILNWVVLSRKQFSRIHASHLGQGRPQRRTASRHRAIQFFVPFIFLPASICGICKVRYLLKF